MSEIASVGAGAIGTPLRGSSADCATGGVWIMVCTALSLIVGERLSRLERSSSHGRTLIPLQASRSHALSHLSFLHHELAVTTLLSISILVWRYNY